MFRVTTEIGGLKTAEIKTPYYGVARMEFQGFIMKLQKDGWESVYTDPICGWIRFHKGNSVAFVEMKREAVN